MTTDLLSVALPTADHPPTTRCAGQLGFISRTHRDDLAHLYLASYPAEIGAKNLADALDELDATFAGDFGALRTDASRLAQRDGKPAGAILVVERSIWDEHLDGPFVIDLFVHPQMRGLGFGEALVLAAMQACEAAGDRRLSLRIGEATSRAAHHLYAQLGFRPLHLEEAGRQSSDRWRSGPSGR